MNNTSTSASTNPVLKTVEGYSSPTDRFKALTEIYKTNPDPITRQQARDAIENFIRSPDTLRGVIEIYLNDSDPDTHQLASSVLDILPGSKDVILLLSELHKTDPDPKVRQFALEKNGQLIASVVRGHVPHSSQSSQEQRTLGSSSGRGLSIVLAMLGLLLISVGVITEVVGLQTDGRLNADLSTVQTTSASPTTCETYQRIALGGTNNRGIGLTTYTMVTYTFTYLERVYSIQVEENRPCDSSLVKTEGPISVEFFPSDPTLAGLTTEDILQANGPPNWSIGAILVGFSFLWLWFMVWRSYR